MNEMIERVAIALWALETETDCHDWNELAQFKKDETYEKAKAALKVVCDMIDAAIEEETHG